MAKQRSKTYWVLWQVLLALALPIVVLSILLSETWHCLGIHHLPQWWRQAAHRTLRDYRDVREAMRASGQQHP